MASILENVTLVQSRIREAAESAGRDPKEILLIAATKMNDAGRVREAISAGVDICGENRVQELLEKNAQHAYDGVPVHFIGHLQKNKVKQIVGIVDLIHSVDSLELLQVIQNVASAKGVVQQVLLEVNIGEEASKSGFRPEDIPGVLSSMSDYPSVLVRGLMAIPPKCSKPEENSGYFSTMRHLFVDNSNNKYDNVCMDFLSMGMSGDYTEAIKHGANMVRVGTAIFGERIYT